jgi:hypothetical protein
MNDCFSEEVIGPNGISSALTFFQGGFASIELTLER